jgi:hypothetical protein
MRISLSYVVRPSRFCLAFGRCQVRIRNLRGFPQSIYANDGILLTELSPSGEAANCAATQELPSILRNPKVHHRVHKSLHSSLSWARSIQSIPSQPISLRYILILSTHLRHGLPSGLFPYSFPANILYAFLFSAIRATCPAHLIMTE